MNVMIIGSMAFVKEMVRIKKELEKSGHKVQIPHGTEPHLKDTEFVEKLEENYKYCIKNDIMRRCFDQVAKSDAVLVINHKRNGIEGYIGVSALMEMGIAHYFKRKIFLLNKIPHFREHRFAHEVTIMQPVVINGDLSKMK